MATAEDVFYLYERNSTYYHNCNNKQGKIDECPDNWLNECYCYTRQEVLPTLIGNQCVPCDIKRKCYIRQGEECPICLEGIFRKKDAFITFCGHSFHKNCIFKSMEIQWKRKYAGNFKCPMCRTNLGTDIHELELRYKNSRNNLDNLENFWLNKNFMLAQTCSNNYDHDIGMNDSCFICSRYREKGELLYEIN